MQRQRMHRSLQLRSESRIYLLVPYHAGFAAKRRADQYHPEMRFRIGWHTVLVTFIGNFQKDRREPVLELLLYFLLH